LYILRHYINISHIQNYFSTLITNVATEIKIDVADNHIPVAEPISAF